MNIWNIEPSMGDYLSLPEMGDYLSLPEKDAFGHDVDIGTYFRHFELVGVILGNGYRIAQEVNLYHWRRFINHFMIDYIPYGLQQIVMLNVCDVRVIVWDKRVWIGMETPVLHIGADQVRRHVFHSRINHLEAIWDEYVNYCTQQT